MRHHQSFMNSLALCVVLLFVCCFFFVNFVASQRNAQDGGRAHGKAQICNWNVVPNEREVHSRHVQRFWESRFAFVWLKCSSQVAALVTTAHTQHAGAEVVKQSEHPKLSNLLYPILQALDEEYLGVDVQFGGMDQRKIFMFAREWLPRIGYKKRAYIMNTLVPGLGKSGKMSSSEPLSKIDFHDSEEEIDRKLKNAYSEDGVVENCRPLSMLKMILFQYLDHLGKGFECGGKEYKTYEETEKAFARGEIKSKAVKEGVAALLKVFLAPIREFCRANQALYDEAYPTTPDGFGLPLEGARVLQVKECTPKVSLVRVLTRHGERDAACPVAVAEQLAEGDHVVVVTHCVEQDLKQGIATAQLVHSTLFQDKQLHTAPVKCSAVGALEWGNVKEAAATEPMSLGQVGKLLKTLSVTDQNAVTFGALSATLNQQPVTVAVKGGLRI